jgi:hypothetical protein
MCNFLLKIILSINIFLQKTQISFSPGDGP